MRTFQPTWSFGCYSSRRIFYLLCQCYDLCSEPKQLGYIPILHWFLGHYHLLRRKRDLHVLRGIFVCFWSRSTLQPRHASATFWLSPAARFHSSLHMLWIQAVISRGLLWTEIHGGIWTVNKIFMKTIPLIVTIFLLTHRPLKSTGQVSS